MSVKKPKRNQNKKEGLNIRGNVNVKDGDFVAGNKNVNLGKGSVYAGGDINNSNIITGNNNDLSKTMALRDELFKEIFKKIETRQGTSLEDRDDLRANVEEIKAETKKEEDANETFLARRLRNIKRMAPDILDVVTAAIANPAAGFAMVVKKISDHVKASATDGDIKA